MPENNSETEPNTEPNTDPNIEPNVSFNPEDLNDSEAAPEIPVEPIEKPEPEPEPSVSLKRFNSLYKKMKTYERELEASKMQTPKPATPEQTKAPNIDDFESHSEYIDKLTDYKVNQRFNKAKEKEVERERTRTTRERNSKIDDIVTNQMAKDPEFVTSALIPAALVDVIDLDSMVDVGYYFGKNRDIADNISAMPKHLAAKEMAKLEIKLKGTKPPVKSKAPKATDSITGGKSTITTDPDKMDMDSYAEYWKAEQKKRRG